MPVRLVESRRKPSRSLAIVLLTLLALILIAGLAVNPGRGESSARATVPPADSLRATEPLPGAPVASFAAFVAERGDGAESIRDHAYAAHGLRKLADALDAVAARDTTTVRDARVQSATLRILVDSLERYPEARNRSDVVRRAFVGTARTLTTLERSHYPHLERAAEEVRVAAWAMTAGRPLEEQGAAVDRFFDRASDLMRAMAGG